MSDENKPEAEKPADAPASMPAKDPEGSVATTETEATQAEASELRATTGGKADEPKKSYPPAAKSDAAEDDEDDEDSDPAVAAAAAHDGHDHAHGDNHDHGLAHTMPVWLLFAVLAALLVLTVATVAVTAIDLGAQGNLIVAMVIATVKAILVCTFFMHLLWDKKFNLVLFMTSVLFLILFLSMATTDRGEYQHLVDEYRAQQLGAK